jgi:hypothetical protein
MEFYFLGRGNCFHDPRNVTWSISVCRGRGFLQPSGQSQLLLINSSCSSCTLNKKFPFCSSILTKKLVTVAFTTVTAWSEPP